MKAILHLGPWKTGTTSAQFWLGQNRGQLLSHGVFFPPGIIDKSVHYELAAAIAGKLSKFTTFEDSYPQYDWRAYIQNCIDEAKNHAVNTVIFSCEDFADLELAGIEQLVDTCLGSGCKQVGLVWARFDPEERIASFCSQFARQGEHVSDEGVEKILVDVRLTLQRLASLKKEFSDRRDVYVVELFYNKDNHEFLAQLIEQLTGRSFTGVGVRINKSLSAEQYSILNRFNYYNTNGRPFDSTCPVMWSQEAKWERERLKIFLSLLKNTQ